MRDFVKLMGSGTLAVVAFLEPTLNFILICTFCVVLDCLSAWMLSRRVKKAFPDKTNKAKFESNYAKKILKTISEIYALILMAYLIDQYLVDFYDLHLPNIVSGIFCFIQFWSILENQSSCNGSKWAKLLQRIMVDKTERHFDVDLSDFKDKNETTDEQH
jgi:hypothetical protein